MKFKNVFVGSILSLVIIIGCVARIDAAKIHDAAARGDVPAVQRLLQDPSIDVDARDYLQWTALMWAAYQGHNEIVQRLLQTPSNDVNAKNNFGNTALIWAASRGEKETVQLLLQAPGIDVNAQNNKGKSALDLANTEEIKTLIQNHIDNEAFKRRGMNTKSSRNTAPIN